MCYFVPSRSRDAPVAAPPRHRAPPLRPGRMPLALLTGPDAAVRPHHTTTPTMSIHLLTARAPAEGTGRQSTTDDSVSALSALTLALGAFVAGMCYGCYVVDAERPRITVEDADALEPFRG